MKGLCLAAIAHTSQRGRSRSKSSTMGLACAVALLTVAPGAWGEASSSGWIEWDPATGGNGH